MYGGRCLRCLAQETLNQLVNNVVTKNQFTVNRKVFY